MSIMLQSDLLAYGAALMFFSCLAFLGGHLTTSLSSRSEIDQPSRPAVVVVTLGLSMIVVCGVLFLAGDFWKLRLDETSITMDRIARSSLTRPKSDLEAIIDVDTNKKAGNHYLELRFKDGRVERSLILTPAETERLKKAVVDWSGIDAQERVD